MRKFSRFLHSDNKIELIGLQLLNQLDNARKVLNLGTHVSIAHYRKQRTLWKPAPYSVTIYEEFLRKCIDRDIQVGMLSELGRGGLVLRHDIDTRECIQRLPILLDAEARYGVMSSVFYRVDNLDYDARDAIEQAKDLKRNGYDVGLHSTAYLDDSCIESFTAEVFRFQEIFGFGPHCFNFHGLGNRRLTQRIKLARRWHDLLAISETLQCTDTMSGYYDYRISDCHLVNSRRWLLSDISEPPPFISNTLKYLLLTHPIYWNIN